MAISKGGELVPVRLAQITEARTITNVINAAFRQAESVFIERDRIDLETVRSLLNKGEFLFPTSIERSQVA